MKTNLDKFYKTNPTYEKEGVNFVLVEEDKANEVEEISMVVRRFNSSNPRVKAAMAAYYKPYARMIELGTLPQEKSDEITIRLFIDVCLVSWKGIRDESGKEIEFNKENAFSLLKSLPDMFESIWKYANNFENFKEEVGNS